MARSAKVKAVEEEQITISEDEVDEPEVHSPDTMPAVEPSSRTRANPFAASEYNGEPPEICPGIASTC